MIYLYEVCEGMLVSRKTTMGYRWLCFTRWFVDKSWQADAISEPKLAWPLCNSMDRVVGVQCSWSESCTGLPQNLWLSGFSHFLGLSTWLYDTSMDLRDGYTQFRVCCYVTGYQSGHGTIWSSFQSGSRVWCHRDVSLRWTAFLLFTSVCENGRMKSQTSDLCDVFT